jgi:hypothetical protein
LGGIELRNDIIFKHQWLLYHKELFLALGRTLITVRRPSPRSHVLYLCFALAARPALLFFALGKVLFVGRFEVKAGLAFGYDEAGPQRVSTGEGVVALIAAASIGREDDERDLQAGRAFSDVVIDLAVDLLVALDQPEKELFPVALLLRLLVDVVLQKLLLVQLEQSVEFEQLVGRPLPSLSLLFSLHLQLPSLLPAPLRRRLYCLFQRWLLLCLRADLLDIQLEINPPDGDGQGMLFFSPLVGVAARMRVEIPEAGVFTLGHLLEVAVQFVRLPGELFGCKINDILAVLPRLHLLPPQHLGQAGFHPRHLATRSALLKHRSPHSGRRRLEHLYYS